ncbi:endolytic transglycosylase MltG [Reichenbachiella carrageenanivorans]|uniref:Endolytic murein transglycosylase n=1 Tax=Reichenbachiella carrageenanivorans TaxID=2979869 RepID=A0ABY6D506_9BACT|nr:endolytic transglycosylase MltG [Reichenbachiella carrageenanivorans]UXX81252.1 endolytic transglycosylase MltG [Reichenbachiella carrageenanivorans]
MDKKKIVLGSVIVAFSMMLSSFGFYFWQMIYSPNFLVEQEAKPLLIHTGSVFKDVQNQMYDGRYVNDLVSFSFLSKMMDYDQLVKPGLYLIEPGMTNVQVIRLLRAGAQTEVNVTFNNARLLSDLPEKITRNLEMTEEQLARLILSDSVQQAYGFDSLSFIGMFVPNTYKMFWNIAPQDLLDRLKREYDRFWSAERLAKAAALGLSPKEVSSLAAIVQAETIKSDERPVVAGVYLNRLKRGYPLQADPTLVFAAQDFTIKRVLNKHKKLDSPYNTYMYQGLPPGPINMPSITSIDAVLNYSEHKYLYFCAKEDFSGYHNFATNLIDHNRNAEKYQRALNKAGLYK